MIQDIQRVMFSQNIQSPNTLIQSQAESLKFLQHVVQKVLGTMFNT